MALLPDENHDTVPRRSDRSVSARAIVEPRLWEAVDALVERAPLPADVAAHRLELLELRLRRDRGLLVPESLLELERAAAVTLLTAPLVLERLRASLEGPILLLKGPEVAARYPDLVLRSFADLDVLVPDAARAQRALISTGFEPVGDPAVYVGIHHLRPLAHRGLPLPVEIHARPKWIARRRPPSLEELLAEATPAAVGIEGILAPSPAHHALLLAAHSWAHEPLRRLRDLIDIAAMIQGLDRRELDALAHAWGIARLWGTTVECLEALLYGGRPPWALRLWAQNMRKARERTVLENHLARWLSDFWALSPRESLGALAETLGREVRPVPGETWGAKLSRAVQAIGNAPRRRSEHDEQLGPAARRRPD
jgi:hypothetical protein